MFQILLQDSNLRSPPDLDDSNLGDALHSIPRVPIKRAPQKVLSVPSRVEDHIFS